MSDGDQRSTGGVEPRRVHVWAVLGGREELTMSRERFNIKLEEFLSDRVCKNSHIMT